MTMADVLIEYAQLTELNARLIAIVEELDAAAGRSEALESAIGNPYGRGELRERAQDFEQRWDIKRGDLARDMKKVQEHVQGVIDGFSKWDAEAAAKFESGQDA
jgi:hypothetical protein